MSRAIALLPLWALGGLYRVNITYIPLPYIFNVNTAIHIMEDLLHIPYNSHPRLASLDTSNMYPNIPTKTLTSLITFLCNWNSVIKKVEREIIKLTRIMLKQYYFQFSSNVYTQTNGLTMEAPTSSVLSEKYLQYLEHTAIFDIRLQHKITGYYRYVDDILLTYDTRHTDAHEVLNQFNKINSKMQFTLEEEENNAIHFLDLTISRTDNNFRFSLYCNPTTTGVPRGGGGV
jgi:hypothetical protein